MHGHVEALAKRMKGVNGMDGDTDYALHYFLWNKASRCRTTKNSLDYKPQTLIWKLQYIKKLSLFAAATTPYAMFTDKAHKQMLPHSLISPPLID